MGKQIYQKKILELFEKSPIVSSDSIKRILKDKKKIKQYHKQIIRNLIKSEKIKRLTKGLYTAHDEISLAVFAFKPSYLGLQNALSFHNLWEQETIPVIITSKKVRQGIRKVMGLNILIRRIDKRYLFGFNLEKQGDFYFPYSDIEKTFIDLVYFRQHIDKEVLKEIKKKSDRKKIKEYLRMYPKKFQKKVLNLL